MTSDEAPRRSTSSEEESNQERVGCITGSCAMFASALHLFRHKDQLSWILRSIQAFVIVSIYLLHFKPTAHQQMFGLKSIQVPHSKRMHQTFLTTIGVRDVVDELNLVDLAGVVSGDNLVAANHAPTIRSRKLGLVAKFLTQIVPHQHFKRGVEKVKDHPSTINQMLVNRLQAGQLIRDGC